MPISDANMKLYPGGSIKSPEWLAIRAFMRARSGDRCEECGVRHLTYGVRLEGEFIDLGLDKDMAVYERELAIFGAPHAAKLMPPLIRIVCTVAHVDMALVDHSSKNLRFWCQRCHNRHDAPSRRANALKTIKAKSGQAELL